MHSSHPKLRFLCPFGEQEAYEAEARGYWGHSLVELDGGVVPVVFYDPVRLQQDLEEETKAGRPFIAEPGLVVVESVTLVNMQFAVQTLYEEKFFDDFIRKPNP